MQRLLIIMEATQVYVHLYNTYNSFLQSTWKAIRESHCGRNQF